VASSKQPTAKEIGAAWASYGSMYGRRDGVPSPEDMVYPTGCILARCDLRTCLTRDEYRQRAADATSVAEYSEPFLWMVERPCSLGNGGIEPVVREADIWSLGRAPRAGSAGAVDSSFRQGHALCRLSPSASVRAGGASAWVPVDASWRPEPALLSERDARREAERKGEEQRRRADETPAFDLWRKRPDSSESEWVGPPRSKEELVPWAMKRAKGRRQFPELRSAQAAEEELESGAAHDSGTSDEVLSRFRAMPLLEQLRQLPTDPPASEAAAARRVMAGAVLIPGVLDGELGRAVVAEVRQLGAGKAGFYRPSFKDGSQLHCRMLCLGRHWNNRTNRYESARGDHDGAPVEPMSEGLCSLGRRLAALARHKDASVLGSRPEGSFSPDLALCNFYRPGEKMGMHQDRSEAPSSLAAGVPVVSLNFGCDAVFVMREVKDGKVLREGGAAAGVSRGGDPALGREAKIRLRHGDALVFGGPARLCLHGVAEVVAGSQPKDCELAAGRLNVTLRQME